MNGILFGVPFYLTVPTRFLSANSGIFTWMVSSQIEDLKTPGLILDVARVRSNAARVSAIVEKHGVRLRPHIKTHKSVEIAKIQTEGHSGAVTVSTLAEAKAFAAAGFSDFTYSVPIEPGKFSEVFELLRSGVKVNVVTDDPDIPDLLNRAANAARVSVSVFLEVDCGDHRSGVDPNSAAAASIPRLISDASNLDFAGILTHGGHSYDTTTLDEIKAIARQERDVMVELAERLRADGIELPTISIGSTPTITHADDLSGIDEVRPGNYILYDAFQATIGSCSFDDCALTILAAIVHRGSDKIIVDAGAIALSKDRGPVDRDADCGYGRVLDLTGNDLGLRVAGVSQEHGVIRVADKSLLEKLKVGDRVRVLANHSCISAAQHTHYNVLENGKIVDKWQIHRGW
ncbi:MAG: alanine racemase [Pyrinomonadaceae bacterium]